MFLITFNYSKKNYRVIAISVLFLKIILHLPLVIFKTIAMRKIFFSFTLFMILGFISTIQAQLCVPDPAYSNKPAGIYPEPYHQRLNPNGGILDSACINKLYKFTLTVVVPDSFPTSFGNLSLDSIVITKNGVLFAPKGIGYSCNPPNCKFNGGTLGCIELKGTPTSDNAIKTYDLKLKVKITVWNGILIINDTLPTYLSDSAHYFLPLFEENSNNCNTSSTYDFDNNEISLIINPNPVAEMLNVSFDILESSKFMYSIMDLNGNKFIENSGYSQNGRVYKEEYIGDLKNGVYLFELRLNGKRFIKKLLIQQ